MIRINLLTIERERAARRAGFQFAQKVPLLCSLVLVATGLLIGWWYWTLAAQSGRLDDELRTAEAEAGRLRQMIQQVQQFEQRRTDLEQRVSLIETLREGQSAPVHMLDEISRALPEGLWLTEIRQEGMLLTISGRCLALTAVTDFTMNLETSGFFKKPVDIVDSQVERASGQSETELIRFVIKAEFGSAGSPQPQAQASR
ncbi:MAG: PilN domain-containing protein [Vicinamibacterales bacterium]